MLPSTSKIRIRITSQFRGIYPYKQRDHNIGHKKCLEFTLKNVCGRVNYQFGMHDGATLLDVSIIDDEHGIICALVSSLLLWNT